MTEQVAGFCWHPYPDVLFGWCEDFQKQEAFIRQQNPSEVPIRLRLFRPVKGALPEAVIEVMQIYNEARRACGAAERVYVVSLHDATMRVFLEARRAHHQANRDLQKADQALDKALQDNRDAIEVLHKKDCPDCSWDGTTIYSEKTA